MNKNKEVTVYCFGKDRGVIAWDWSEGRVAFQTISDEAVVSPIAYLRSAHSLTPTNQKILPQNLAHGWMNEFGWYEGHFGVIRMASYGEHFFFGLVEGLFHRGIIAPTNFTRHVPNSLSLDRLVGWIHSSALWRIECIDDEADDYPTYIEVRIQHNGTGYTATACHHDVVESMIAPTFEQATVAVAGCIVVIMERLNLSTNDEVYIRNLAGGVMYDPKFAFDLLANLVTVRRLDLFWPKPEDRS